MTIHETRFVKLPEILHKLEDMAGRTFVNMIDAGSTDPMTDLANMIAVAHDGEGYAYGMHSENAQIAFNDPNKAAVRMKDGHGIIVDPHDTEHFDLDRAIADITPLEAVLFATDVKTSLNGYYMLVRYDLIASYGNPYMNTVDAYWTFAEGVMCECRSTVIDVRNMSVVSLPYYKFRNLGETVSYDLDHVRAAIEAAGGKLIATEKLDGSMIQMRYVGDEDAFDYGLLFSTSGTLAGSAGAVGNDHIGALVRYHLTGDELDRYLGVAKAYPDYTFIYEFVHPEADRHVVLYKDEKHGLFMTGARRITDGKLAGYAEIVKMADEFAIPYPCVMATDLDEALAIKRDGDGTVCEGMVVNVGDSMDGGCGGWLVKVKLDGFLALSHIHHEIEGAAGFKSICRMAKEGTLDDAMPVLPDVLKEYIEAVVHRLEAYETAQRAVIDKLVSDGLDASDGGRDRKAYALYVNNLACPGFWKGWLFQAAFNGGVDCFWADRKGDDYRYLAQGEFEAREADLETYLAS